MPTDRIRFELVTAERVVYADDVDVVIVPGVVGQMAILPHHAPLLTSLQIGELVVRKDGEETTTFVSGGFIEVRGDKVVVLADIAERAEEIDIARAEAARKRAEERIRAHPPEVELSRAHTALTRSLVRLKVAERRRRRREGGPPGPGGI